MLSNVRIEILELCDICNDPIRLGPIVIAVAIGLGQEKRAGRDEIPYPIAKHVKNRGFEGLDLVFSILHICKKFKKKNGLVQVSSFIPEIGNRICDPENRSRSVYSVRFGWFLLPNHTKWHEIVFVWSIK